MVGGDVLDAAALHPDHALNPMLCRIRDNLSGPEALWWWRTCETYGALSGQRFAEQWSSFLGCRSAGHTHIIGVWQSGLRGIRPNQKAWWGPEEGLASGTPARPTQARLSSMRAPDTISFLSGTIPERCWRWRPGAARAGRSRSLQEQAPPPTPPRQDRANARSEVQWQRCSCYWPVQHHARPCPSESRAQTPERLWSSRR